MEVQRSMIGWGGDGTCVVWVEYTWPKVAPNPSSSRLVTVGLDKVAARLDI